MGEPRALTICIPTIPARRSLLSRLLWSLETAGAHLDGRIEVLVADGVHPMGDKLNAMFASASGEHVVAIDDDDYVSQAYLAVVAPYLPGVPGPDFIGHDILYLENGRFAGIVSHSLEGDPAWSTFDRGVSPKCPVRTTLARRHRFGNHYTADREWSQAVHADCRTGEYAPHAVYVYDHWDAHTVGTEPTDPRFGQPQRDVGVWPYTPEHVTWI